MRPLGASGPIQFPCTLQSPFHQNAHRHEPTLDHKRTTHSALSLSHSRSSSVNSRCSLKHTSDRQSFKPKSIYEWSPECSPSPPPANLHITGLVVSHVSIWSETMSMDMCPHTQGRQPGPVREQIDRITSTCPKPWEQGEPKVVTLESHPLLPGHNECQEDKKVTQHTHPPAHVSAFSYHRLGSPMSSYGQLNPPLQPAPSSQTVKLISHLTTQAAWSDTLHQMLSLRTHVWKCIHTHSRG